VETPRRCNHPEGHELNLTPGEALAVETFRECPCCGTQLWITIPSVGEVLDAANDRGCSVPGLNVELTRRERQVLNTLHRSPYALRHAQLAALVWSDAHRTNDVRSVLYQLRRKLRASGWAIPFPPSGEGVRLMAEVDHRRPESVGNQPDVESEIIHQTASHALRRDEPFSKRDQHPDTAGHLEDLAHREP
jgi:DNA-binding winged helix-turn-helix (wHTH) protein